MAQAKRRKRMFRVVAGLALATGFVALVIYGSLHSAGYRCEVCITFRGQQACRQVEGPSAAEARASAINNACAVLAAGVTETLACERTVPDREDCQPIP